MSTARDRRILKHLEDERLKNFGPETKNLKNNKNYSMQAPTRSHDIFSRKIPALRARSPPKTCLERSF
jgi:hypothetical protein